MFRYLILTLTCMTLTHPTYASQPSLEEQYTLIPAPRAVTMAEDADCTSRMAYSCAKLGYCCDYKQPFCSTDGVISNYKSEVLAMAGGGALIGGTLAEVFGIFGQLTIWGKCVGWTVLQWTGVGCWGCSCILCTTVCCLGSRKCICKEEFKNPKGGVCLPGCFTKKCCPNYAKEYERVYTELKGSNKPAVLYMSD